MMAEMMTPAMNTEMSYPQRVDVAVGIVWREDGHFLAALRPEQTSLAGFWEFPGGKRELHEDIESALKREMYEELAIIPEHILLFTVLRHDYPELSVRLHFFHVLSYQGTPIGHEGQDIRWVTPEDARTMNFLPANAPLLHSLVPPEGI